MYTGVLYVLFGIFGKFSAVFVTLPYPVLGGAIVVLFGIFFGLVISNLEVSYQYVVQPCSPVVNIQRDSSVCDTSINISHVFLYGYLFEESR